MADRIPAGVYLTERDCARLDPLLLRVMRDMQLRDGGVPKELVHVVAPIHKAAVEFRETALINRSSSRSSGTESDEVGSGTGVSEATERLTAAQVAEVIGVTDRYVRRLVARGVLKGMQCGSRGAWVIDVDSVAQWKADRNDRKAS